jgi:hypothetical protein
MTHVNRLLGAGYACPAGAAPLASTIFPLAALPVSKTIQKTQLSTFNSTDILI